MGERMKGERLAFLLQQPECNWPESELLQALIAERGYVAELEAEQKGDRIAIDGMAKDLTKLEAQINAMKELPDKWRSEIIQNPTYTGTARNRRTKECAGELDNITG